MSNYKSYYKVTSAGVSAEETICIIDVHKLEKDYIQFTLKDSQNKKLIVASVRDEKEYTTPFLEYLLNITGVFND